MVDFIIDVIAEIADFFIDLWSDKIMVKFAANHGKKKRYRKKQGISDSVFR